MARATTLALSLAAVVVAQDENAHVCYTFCARPPGRRGTTQRHVGGLSNYIGLLSENYKYASTRGARFLLPSIRPTGHNLTHNSFEGLFGPPEWHCIVPWLDLWKRIPGAWGSDAVFADGWEPMLGEKKNDTVKVLRRNGRGRGHAGWKNKKTDGCEILVELGIPARSEYIYGEIRSLLRDPYHAARASDPRPPPGPMLRVVFHYRLGDVTKRDVYHKRSYLNETLPLVDVLRATATLPGGDRTFEVRLGVLTHAVGPRQEM